eukprot:5256933-Alexandrium_andersonii.AAC.1
MAVALSVPRGGCLRTRPAGRRCRTVPPALDPGVCGCQPCARFVGGSLPAPAAGHSPRPAAGYRSRR